MDREKNKGIELPEVAELEDLLISEESLLEKPRLLMYYRSLKDRVLYLDADVDEEIINDLVRYVIMFNCEDKGKPTEQRRPIKILIYSYGGDANAMFQLIDVCMLSKTPVYTYNMGVCMSAGFDIYLVGSKRYALKNSQALIHQGSAQFGGTAQQVTSQNDMYKKQLKSAEEWILSRTKITEKEYKKKKEQEWYVLGGEEQVEKGIATDILTDLDDIFV